MILDLERLPGLIVLVKGKLAALPTFDWQHRAPYDAAVARLIDELTEAGATIRNEWDGAAISFGGVRSTATGGMTRALHNWLRAAGAKCEAK